jgi:hypothetical protein
MRTILSALLFATLAAPAAEVTLHRWSGGLNVPDPVACTVDEKGRVYVAATRRGSLMTSALGASRRSASF